MRTCIRYCLLQLPGLAFLAALLSWIVASELITPAIALAIVAIWLLKDAAMYPFAKRALELPMPAIGTAALLGRETHVARTLEPRGQVRIGSERWLARSRRNERIPAGRRVRVVDAEGLELVVEVVERG
jgi:membrane protein implicated in regulation of membrane protease activity